MKIYDITQELFGCCVYPGDPKPVRTRLMSMEAGDDANLTALSMCAHNGTHMDAPAHFIREGKTIDQLDLELVSGKTAVVTWTGDLDAEAADHIYDVVSGKNNSAFRISDRNAFSRLLLKGRLRIRPDGAERLVSLGVKLIGVESQTVGADEEVPAIHKIFLGNGLFILEGLRLQAVPDGAYMLSASPLNLGGAEGAPVRAILHPYSERKMTTLAYIRNDRNQYLMLYRNKKENDENEGKWVGIGGKVEDGEAPDECMTREIREETGLEVLKAEFRGVVTFVSDIWDNEYMFLYEVTDFQGDILEECPEGELRWVDADKVMSLPMWEGDRYFLDKMVNTSDCCNMKLVYEGDRLVSVQ